MALEDTHMYNLITEIKEHFSISLLPKVTMCGVLMSEMSGFSNTFPLVSYLSSVQPSLPRLNSFDILISNLSGMAMYGHIN